MSDDDKKKVNIEDLPVPLKELDKEEQENVTGGVGDVNTTLGPIPENQRPINPLNPSLSNPTFNR